MPLQAVVAFTEAVAQCPSKDVHIGNGRGVQIAPATRVALKGALRSVASGESAAGCGRSCKPVHSPVSYLYSQIENAHTLKEPKVAIKPKRRLSAPPKDHPGRRASSAIWLSGVNRKPQRLHAHAELISGKLLGRNGTRNLSLAIQNSESHVPPNSVQSGPRTSTKQMWFLRQVLRQCLLLHHHNPPYTINTWQRGP